jgi:hypothetical protein
MAPKKAPAKDAASKEELPNAEANKKFEPIWKKWNSSRAKVTKELQALAKEVGGLGLAAWLPRCSLQRAFGSDCRTMRSREPPPTSLTLQDPGCIVYSLGKAFLDVREYFEELNRMTDSARAMRDAELIQELQQVSLQHPDSLLALKLRVDMLRWRMRDGGGDGKGLREALEEFKKKMRPEDWSDPKGDLAVWDGYSKATNAMARVLELMMGIKKVQIAHSEGHISRQPLQHSYDEARQSLGLVAKQDERSAKLQMVGGSSWGWQQQQRQQQQPG